MKFGKSLIWITLAGLLSVMFPLTSGAAVPIYGLISTMPAETGLAHITSPRDIAIDTAGNRYVVDSGNSIVKFDANGVQINTMAMIGAVAVAVGIDNYLYVLVGQGYVYVYDGNGTQMDRIGEGSGSNLPGYFLHPVDVAVDHDGHVYVADTGNHRIQRFDSNGTHLLTIGTGSSSANDGEFDKPTGIAVDANKNIYVVDQNNHRVQKFNENGVYQSKWGTQGVASNQFAFPSQIYVVNSGPYEGLYVTDGNGRVQKIDLALTATTADLFGSYGTGEGFMNGPRGIAIDGNGNIYVTDQYRAQVFDASGNYTATLGGSRDGQFLEAVYVSADGEGNIYVADRMNHRILKYDSTGQYVQRWGSYGTGQGEFDEPMDIAIDTVGNVYVTDRGNDRVQKFGADGSFITEWGGEGNVPGKFHYVSGIATDSLNNVYVADTLNDNIQKFTTDGVLITSWDGAGGGTVLRNPEGIAINSRDELYVADSLNDRIVKYDADGNFITTWGSVGNGNGQFAGPFGVAIDAADTVYVVDSGWSRVQTFTADGDFITKWSDSVSYPRGIAVTSLGDIAVMNLLPNRITIYAELQPLSDLAAAAGDRSVSLTFSASRGARSIFVQYSADGGANWAYGDTAAPLTAASTSAIVTGLTNGTAYQFRLQIYGGKHHGTSNVANATPQTSSSGGNGGGGAPVLSSNADLKSLSINAGTLNPQFNRSVTNYKMKVEHNISTIEVKASVDDANAVLHISEVKHNSGEALLFPLQVGSNSIEIKVTAPNGTTQRYVIEVERAAPPVLPDPIPKTPKIDFTDIDGHWAKEAIMQAVGQGFAKGYPDQTFRPDQPVTRAEFVAFIAQFMGWTNPDDLALPFTDQEDIPSWVQGYMAAAVKEGVIHGYEDGSFRAKKPITRTEAVSIMMRLMKQPQSTDAATGFADDQDIPAWGKGYVGKAVELGIVAGRSGNRFAPEESITRAETVALLRRISQQ